MTSGFDIGQAGSIVGRAAGAVMPAKSERAP
jgi:hypothetical protein